MKRWNAWTVGLTAGFLGAALAACGRGDRQNTAPSLEEKTFSLMPAFAPVKAAFLTGQLENLKVTERVERGAGKMVDPPILRATLKLENTSADQAARLLSGKLQYLDAEGNPIPLAAGPGEGSFAFSTYPTDRLDPGKETSQAVEVPFPEAALGVKKLRDIRLGLTYLPTPYREETVSIPVTVGG